MGLGEAPLGPHEDLEAEAGNVEAGNVDLRVRSTELDYCDIEWVALETNRDHSVVFASKYCNSDSLVDHDGSSISSKGFLPTVVDIMVI